MRMQPTQDELSLRRDRSDSSYKAKAMKNKLIVFVAGGISYAEIVWLQQLEKEGDLEHMLIIGGSERGGSSRGRVG